MNAVDDSLWPTLARDLMPFLPLPQAQRRKIAVDKAREQLVALREVLEGLKGVEGEDSRPAVQEVVHPIVVKVRWFHHP